jgi:hypothetical protein
MIAYASKGARLIREPSGDDELIVGQRHIRDCD